MNYKKYYDENVSYQFNKEKMQKLVSDLKTEGLKKELERQYEKINYALFDKVNTKENVLKYISLIETELKSKKPFKQKIYSPK